MTAKPLDDVFIWNRWYHKPSTFYQAIYNEKPSVDQARFLDSLPSPENNRMMICSAGGTGKTKSLGAAVLWFPTVYSKIMRHPYSALIISGSQEQSRILYHWSQQGLNHPEISKLILGESLKTHTNFTTGAYMKCLPRSFKAIFGQHVPIVVVDEACEAGDDVILDTYRIVSGQPDNRIILSSTPQYYMSLFVDMWEDRSGRYKDWIRFPWAKTRCHWIDPAEIEEARRVLPPDKFAIFWEGKPVPLVGTLVSQADLKECSPAVRRFSYNPEGELPVMGVDWGFKAPTVITIRQKLDSLYYILLTREYKGKQYKSVQEWISHYYKAYHVGRLYADAASIGENQRLVSEHNIPVSPVKFKSQKPMLRSWMKALFEQHLVRIPEECIELKQQLSRYTWETNTRDDYVDSLMLALREPVGFRKPLKLWWKVIEA